ncbi:MAG: RecQ family ATP-dependent DNA helicase [Bacteroidia bacterium]|nr:RecQ family ATP-dependent DNA helicase [Bacteroidia bacterium]
MTEQVAFEDAVEALHRHFGYPGFRTGQDHIVRTILSGRDTIAIMPTGGGKSICYQIPAILRDGLTIVVSPLISLMQDQVSALDRVRIPSTFINSVIDHRELIARLEKARGGWYKLMYVAPERFESPAFLQRIKGVKIGMLAVDEAHCISEWGHDFRPSYKKLRSAIEELGRPQVVALTATATPDVRLDIQTQLGLEDPEIIVRGFDRPNLTFRVMKGVNKRDEIFRLCSGGDVGIVYAGTRNTVEELALVLRQHGIPAEPYHAGLDSAQRAQVQERFMCGATRIIVATTAFGMGIDKADVRFVVHHDMPGTLEQYYQEAGRAGRDGKESSCVLLFHPKDRGLPEFFIRNTFPDKAVIQRVYSELHRLAGTPLGQTYHGLLAMTASALADSIGSVSESAVRGALDVLERDGHVRRITESWVGSTVRFLLDHDTMRQWLIESASAMQQPVAVSLLRRAGAEAFYEPTPLFLDELTDAAESPVEEILPILQELHAERIIDFVPGRKGSGIALLGPRISAPDLPVDYSAIERRMQHQLEKLRAVEMYISSSACRRNMILQYFQESDISGVCGKCDVCTSTVITLEDGTSRLAVEEGGRHILHCAAETGGRFGRLTLADILRGAKTRRITEYRLFRAGSYGKLRHFDKVVILEALDALIGQGWLARTEGVRPSVYLTEAGRGVLGYSVPLMDIPTAEEASGADIANLALYEALRSTRRRVAARLNLPSHVLIPERVLRAMANHPPSSREECLAIDGMGPITFQKCGRELLTTIRDHLHENAVNAAMKNDANAIKDISPSLRAIWECAVRGLSIDTIAIERGITAGVVSNQLADLIRQGVALPIDTLVPAAHQKEIQGAVMNLRDRNLKRIKAVVDSSISYAEIRVMLAFMDRG